MTQTQATPLTSAQSIIYPVIRKAELTNPGMELTRTYAKRIANNIHRNINKNIPKFLLELGKAFSPKYINVEDSYPKVREEGKKVFIVDYPIISASKGDLIYNIRITTAICFKKSSSKNWTRVSIEKGVSFENNRLIEVKNSFNEIVNICCKLNQQIFIDVAIEEINNSPSSIGDFTIMTFGITDDKLGKCLELFDDFDLKLKSLFTSDHEAKRLIESYYKSLFNKASLGKGDWATDNVSFVTNDNYVADSNVLYNIESKGNSITIEGIGHDESSEGVVAKISSLKVAYLIEEIRKSKNLPY